MISSSDGCVCRMRVWIVLVVVILLANWAMYHAGPDPYSLLGQTFLFFALADFASGAHQMAKLGKPTQN